MNENSDKPTNAPRAAPTNKPATAPQHQDEIPIAQLRPAAPGAGMLHPGDLTRTLTARVKGTPGYDHGYEITWVRPRRAFRVDHYENNEPKGTRWVPEGRVDEYVEA